MNDVLKDELLYYLGELTYDYENTFDYQQKDIIASKINAINTLLGFESKLKTWYEKIAIEIKKLS